MARYTEERGVIAESHRVVPRACCANTFCPFLLTERRQELNDTTLFKRTGLELVIPFEIDLPTYGLTDSRRVGEWGDRKPLPYCLLCPLHIVDGGDRLCTATFAFSEEAHVVRRDYNSSRL